MPGAQAGAVHVRSDVSSRRAAISRDRRQRISSAGSDAHHQPRRAVAYRIAFPREHGLTEA